jgi:predicted RND superfamily exporter protein
MIELVISVGFSVDFSAHICHAYLSSSLRDKGSRVKEALELAGGPVINGSLSTILGIFMLVFSRSFIFQSFFKVIFMVITFGLLHAVLVLPVILSFGKSGLDNGSSFSVAFIGNSVIEFSS